MKINILLPHKEKFSKSQASSVSITINNNLKYSSFLNNINVFGQYVDDPLHPKNFKGFKYTLFSMRSKNCYLADKMVNFVLQNKDKDQIIEVHNRPYLINRIYKKIKNYPISLFLHNNPMTMKGSKTIFERKNLLKKCKAIFCVSKYIKSQFLDGITNQNQKVHVLYNGVDRNLKKFPEKKKEVLFIGRLVKEKGVDLYINAVKSVSFHFKDWKFGLIGSYKLGTNTYSNSYSNEIEKAFKNIGYQARFYGFKQQNFVQKKLSETSIIVVPSIWNEPFGLVVAEAMSNGVAIIASSVGGIPEIVKDNGILIENIDSDKIKKSLTELIKDEKKRKILQQKSWSNFNLSSKKTSEELDLHRNLILKGHYQ